MIIYAVSKGEGKQLNVKTTKFFMNEIDANAYRDSLTTMGDYHIIRQFDRVTDKMIHESIFYLGKNVSAQDKHYHDLNQMVYGRSYYVKCEWERRPYNPYVVTPLNIE